MLYLPLAYIVVFGFSLVRLIYDMVTQKPNAGLNVVSLWFVMSVGLIDALIYVSRPLPLFFLFFAMGSALMAPHFFDAGPGRIFGTAEGTAENAGQVSH